MNTNTQAPIAFQFTEEMKGYLAAGQTSFDDGYKQGQADGSYFMFHLTIKTDDVDQFLASPEHRAQAIGYVEGDLVGGRRPVLLGVFNLFVDTADRNRKEMRYRLFFENAEGKPFTLSGFKQHTERRRSRCVGRHHDLVYQSLSRPFAGGSGSRRDTLRLRHSAHSAG